MRYFLIKSPLGTASIVGAAPMHGERTGGSYQRPLRNTEIVDGRLVSDYPAGTHPVKVLPPEPQES